ncbi:MAG TPA: hypothetical protein VMS08_05055 [Candidatus Saccharimonadia bacterium]|nr:hypothetical protein [Candidatus Saccharimonadia bacterium]
MSDSTKMCSVLHGNFLPCIGIPASRAVVTRLTATAQKAFDAREGAFYAWDSRE